MTTIKATCESLCKAINEDCGNQFNVRDSSASMLSLDDGTTPIFSGWDFEVEARLRQIAKENQVQL